MYSKILIIGGGLIGSSIARAARRLAEVMVITDADVGARGALERLGIADAVAENAADHADAELVVLCVPPGAMVSAAQDVVPRLSPGAVVTDVGSLKGSVIRDVAPLVPEGVHFIPGHPIAGTEHSGPEAGFAELFRGRWGRRRCR